MSDFIGCKHEVAHAYSKAQAHTHVTTCSPRVADLTRMAFVSFKHWLTQVSFTRVRQSIMWCFVFASFASLAGATILDGISDDLASQFHDMPTSVVAAAIANGLGKALDTEGVPASDFACVRDYSAACPEGWADQGDGETCSAPMYYQGQCATHENFAALTPTEKRAKASACGTEFRCVDTCTMDFSSPCPDGWDTDRSNHCVAPSEYAGPCIGRKDFRGASSSTRNHWSSLCNVRWPCRRQRGDVNDVGDDRGCAADYSKTCPAGWTIVGIQCVAPIDYQGPCATMIDLSRLAVAQKAAYAKACELSWPCGVDSFLDTVASFLQYASRDGASDPQHFIADSKLQVSQLNVAKKEVSKLIPRVKAGGWMSTKALTRLVSLTTDPNAKSVMISAGVEAAAETLMKRPDTSDRNVGLAGSLLTMLSGMPVAVEVSDEVGANGHVDVVIPRPSRVYHSDEVILHHSFGVSPS